MQESNQMPKEEGFDHSLSLLREGYRFILDRRQSLNSDVFETRILGKKVICMGGKEAAKVFYDTDKFKRAGAAPNRVVQTLFGKNGVQSLDGSLHENRKHMFMSTMSPEAIQRLSEIVQQQWDLAASRWEQMDEVIFYEEVKELLCRAACEWAGVPFKEDEVKKLTKELAGMFETPVTFGPAHWLGRNGRNNIEKWVGQIIEDIRNGNLHPPEGTALDTFAKHQDLEGNLLDAKTVAVEVINILRPIVAISIFLNFTVLALHQYPFERKRLSEGGDYIHFFVEEVRRFYPFFPLVGAIVKKDFTWRDYQFKEGKMAFLDIYGTNHDPKIWENPEVFNPERFAERKGNLYDFIPQGGGKYLSGHRCAGEWATIEVMKVSTDYLANRLLYEVPEQDLTFSMTDIPSIPNSKIILKNVKRLIN